MFKRKHIVLLAAVFLALGLYWIISFSGPRVYLSGQKALVRWGNSVPGKSVDAMVSTVTFWTTDMKHAAIAMSSNMTGSGYVSLEPDKFADELSFKTTGNYGVLASTVNGSEVDIMTSNNGKYPISNPKTGPAKIYISDKSGQGAKPYDIEIKNVTGDIFTFTEPANHNLTVDDSGSPIVQDGAFVGAAQTPDKGISAPKLYSQLMKDGGGGNK